MRINSVGPDGAISFRDAPFTLCGNRGAIDHGGKVTTPYKGHRWIYCVTGALRDPAEFMDGRSVTDLFFLDEATALAAGHRPCHQCNGPRAKEFGLAWVAARLADTSNADTIDVILTDDRLTPEKTKKTFTADAGDLPVGSMINLKGRPFLLCADVAYPWTPEGYGIPRDLPQGAVEVLTPKSTTLVLQQPSFTLSTQNLVMRWEADSSSKT